MKFFLLSLCWSFFSFNSFSQITSVPRPGSDTIKIVQILNADRYGYKKKDSLTELQVMVGNVRLKQDNTLFYCDSAVQNSHAGIIEAFGNIHINDEDSVHTYAQYLLYYTESKTAILKKKVRLTDNKTNLFTEELEYDVNQKIGIYRNGGRVLNGTSVLTSKEGTYYADLKDVYFKKDVILTDPQYRLESDSLLYNTESEIATFIAKTFIEDSAKRTIRTSDGFYDLKNKKAFFAKRPIIKDGPTTVIANDVETDDKSGISKLRGNAVFVDTAQGISVLSNFMLINRNDETFLATQRPLMILKQDKDSIYIAADTLYSGRLSKLLNPATDSIVIRDTIKGTVVADTKKNDSADRYFQAYRHVRIFSDSLQAVADSLFYSGKDSIFQLFTDPILWANENQITGDTIYLYTKNKKAERLYVFENGLAINKSGPNMYNQVKGNRLNGFFKDGDIDYMRARGNAESVYYVKDEDSALVGINKASGDIIDMRFKNKELNRVVVISEPKGTIYPINKMPDEEKLLRNFHWHDARRPKTKYELFGN